MINRKINLLVCFFILVFSACSNVQIETNTIDVAKYKTEFEMPDILLPDIPDFTVKINDFGGIPDGVTINTKAFADAIQHLSDKGGGKLIVPKGIWYTGPITLVDNINIHLEAGALVLFSANYDDYPLIETSFEGLNTFRCTSPINAKNVSNIAFTGNGVFDGNGFVWRPVKKSKLTPPQWEKLIASGGVLNEKGSIWYPNEQALLGTQNSNMNVPENRKTKEDFEEIKPYLRPVMVSLVECDRVLLDGPTFQNSPAWNIHPLMCTNFVMRNVEVKNPWFSQNGDGLDLESCKNALIENCNFDVGDDAICFKSGKNKTGRDRGIPTENVIVKDCIVYHGHGGFVVGSEMSGGVNNVKVSNCTFIGTDVGLRFKSTRGRGGVIENIYISDINMVNIANDAIRFNLYYFASREVRAREKAAKTAEELLAVLPEVSEETPEFKNIYMDNIKCNGANRAVYMQGLPEKNLKNIQITNVSMLSKYGVFCLDAEKILFDNFHIQTKEGPVFYFENVKNSEFRDLSFASESEDKIMQIGGFFSEKIQLNSSDFEDVDKQVEIDNKDQREVLILN